MRSIFLVENCAFFAHVAYAHIMSMWSIVAKYSGECLAKFIRFQSRTLRPSSSSMMLDVGTVFSERGTSVSAYPSLMRSLSDGKAILLPAKCMHG